MIIIPGVCDTQYTDMKLGTPRIRTVFQYNTGHRASSDVPYQKFDVISSVFQCVGCVSLVDV